MNVIESLLVNSEIRNGHERMKARPARLEEQFGLGRDNNKRKARDFIKHQPAP